ncbi:MAG TPA: ATP-binding cassette domain-containing protein [Protaetiibacter sp.]|jgi:ABC-type dipeptide/oligopeptide/nickel transport system ATPase component|nr:ATP-binding cassette domain-containing protein [Protaetiibacter sp.]
MIRAQGLTKRYGDTTAVDDLSFVVRPGTVTGFLGPNGSGKSTTMRMLVGLDSPTSGRIDLDGSLYRELRDPLRHVGVMLDGRAVHPGRSAYRHLLSVAQTHSIPRARVEEVLDMVGLSAVAHRRDEVAGSFDVLADVDGAQFSRPAVNRTEQEAMYGPQLGEIARLLRWVGCEAQRTNRDEVTFDPVEVGLGRRSQAIRSGCAPEPRVQRGRSAGNARSCPSPAPSNASKTELNSGQRQHIERIVLAKLHRQQAVNDQRKAKLESANTEVRQRVRDALDLLQDVRVTYTNAPVTVRQQLNQAIFAGIFLGPEPGQIRAELNEPFASITQPR